MWAWAYPEKSVKGRIPPSACMTWKKTIYRVRPITPKQSDKLLMQFCSKIMEKWNCSIGLDGINYLGQVEK